MSAVEWPAAVGIAEAICAFAAFASAVRPMYSYDSARSFQSLSEPPFVARRAASLLVTSSIEPALADDCPIGVGVTDESALEAVCEAAMESGAPNRK
jgi:hypothetical protein